ncbi:hypothetical protein DSO57_1003208 [Entomophthora muscae]|uniref:Uncharacterized protein n=1 Tax=Entomophthora muscae TaxID=34485 RepID=A0ACC2RZI4_9FUNG|nr:hypothetical protein DSO57_1003208 [Entomophthora muscae]
MLSCIKKIKAGLALSLWLPIFCKIVLSEDQSPTIQFGPNAGSLTTYPNDLQLDQDVFKGYSVMGFGDFNSDKYTDIILLHDDLKSLQVAIFDDKKSGFVPSNFAYSAKSEIVNVVPADWNYDGRLDLLILTKTDHAKVLNMEILLGSNSVLVPLDGSSYQTSNIQPMVVDINGDMRPDLLGYVYLEDKKEHVLTAWLNLASSENIFLVETMTPGNFFSSSSSLPNVSEATMCRWKSPHSNAFVDLNGDCLPDIFVVCEEESEFQIWINKPAHQQSSASFVLERSDVLPNDFGPVVFSDLHGQGALGMVFPTCTDSGCTIHTVENKQKPLCDPFSTSNYDDCRSQEDLCSADPDFLLALTDQDSHLQLNLSELLKDNDQLKDMVFLFSPGTSTYASSLPIRVGDYNLDGYPDLLVSLSDSKASSGKTAIAILVSTPCTAELCTSAQVSSRKRTYRLLTQGIQPLLNQTSHFYDGHFFDFKEDGTLDLLVADGKGAERRLVAINNGFHNDAFFLKTLVSNGACPRSCSYNSHPYGVNHVGASVKLTVVDTAGTTYARQAAQLPQTAYFGFQTPYSHIGLGRTNNYLQQLSVGVSRNRQKNHFNSWSGVIPNSQLVILPYQSPGSTDPTEWTRELFLNPGRAATWVLVVLALCMVTLAIVVSVLTWLEKRADEKERKQAIHHINFDAL